MTTTVTWLPAQWGTGSDPLTWSEGTQMGMDILGAIRGGIVFNANNQQSLRFATVSGDTRILEGPIVTSLTLTASANAGPTGPYTGVLEVGVVPDPQPANFSATLLPWSRSEVSLGMYDVFCVLQPAISTQTITLTSAAMALIRAHVTSSSRWNGKLALSLRGTAAGGGTVRLFTNPLPDGSPGTGIQATGTTVQATFFSGLSGGPAGKVRAVRDGRFGLPAWSTELMRDGDQPSLWVRDFDVDPEDPDATYRPKPGEGTTDDEIPNP